MKRLLFLFIILNILLIPNVLAKQGHMKLLAVKESENGYEGGIADLYLEIKPGSGRVFLETFPLTKTDTQMSTRFAKAIACDIIEKDCDDTDFFYTITADSAIIAGPSAGSSLAIPIPNWLKDEELSLQAVFSTLQSTGFSKIFVQVYSHNSLLASEELSLLIVPENRLRLSASPEITLKPFMEQDLNFIVKDRNENLVENALVRVDKVE